MKHAFIILAYNEMELLKKLISHLVEIPCAIYLNIDGKLNVSDNTLRWLQACPSIKSIHRRKVNWGGFSILKAEMDLLSLALKDSSAGYFHFLSGQDYPIRPMGMFLKYFEEKAPQSYLDFKQAPYWAICERLLYYMPHDIISARVPKGKTMVKQVKKIQRRFHMERSLLHIPQMVYLGSQWCSLTKEAGKFIVEYTRQHPEFYNRLRHTFAPEEMYFPTILANYFKKEKVNSSNNLRFIRWADENGNTPANLGPEHLKFLGGNDLFFARKVTTAVSLPLISAIDNYLVNHYTTYKRYFEYDKNVAESIVGILRDLQVSSILAIGDRLLYLDAMLGSKFLANGLVFSNIDLNMAKLLNIDKFCQLTSWSEQLSMEPEERYDCLLMVNFFSQTKHDLSKVLSYMKELVAKYVLVVEDNQSGMSCIDFGIALERAGFSTNSVLNQILTAKIPHIGDSIKVFLLIKE